MEFNKQYLTYGEYKGLGGTLDLMPFNILEFEARKKIDIKTFNRLKDIDSNDIPQEVKLCVYKMIDSMSNYDKTLGNISSNGSVASETIDGYSVHYLDSSQVKNVIESKSVELDDIIDNYLIGVIVNGEHIMFVGV